VEVWRCGGFHFPLPAPVAAASGIDISTTLSSTPLSRFDLPPTHTNPNQTRNQTKYQTKNQTKHKTKQPHPQGLISEFSPAHMASTPAPAPPLAATANGLWSTLLALSLLLAALASRRARAWRFLRGWLRGLAADYGCPIAFVAVTGLSFALRGVEGAPRRVDTPNTWDMPGTWGVAGRMGEVRAGGLGVFAGRGGLAARAVCVMAGGCFLLLLHWIPSNKTCNATNPPPPAHTHTL